MLHVLLGFLPLLQQPAAPAKAQRSPAAEAAPIRYDVTLDTKNRKWRVEMEVEMAKGGPFELWVPRWTPGGYHLVDFGQFVDDMKAFDEAGKPLEVTEAEDPVHWTVKPGDAKKIKIRYSANHAFDGMLTAKSMDVEANHLGDAYAYLNSASLFALIPGQLERRALVKMNPPKDWKVATPLEATSDGWYSAPSYYRLEDSPFLMSPDLRIVDFKVAGVPHRLAVLGKTAEEAETLAQTCAKIAEAGKKVMGSLPYDHYVFLLGFLPDGGMGGLEHSYSNLTLLPGFVPLSEVNHILAHEYFHLWCAERIQVEALRRPDYTKPLVTGTLWLNEGATEYMSLVLLYHAGIVDQRGFQAEIARKYSQVFSQQKIATKKTLVETSRGWTNAGLPEFMTITLSIYERGAVNFFAMDLSIRSQTQGKLGFADALRYLMSEYVDKGKGFPEDELPQIFEKATGAKLLDFYNSYINGKELPALDTFLAPYGWKVNRNAKGNPTRGAFHDLDEPTPEQMKLREAFFSVTESR